MKFRKYFSFGLLIVIGVAAIAFTIVTGWNFGKVKAQVWLITVGGIFFAIIFIFEPLRILFVSLYKTFVMNQTQADVRQELFDSCQSELSELEQLKRRSEYFSLMLRKSLYEPISFEEKQRIIKKLQKEKRTESLLLELILFSVFLLTLTLFALHGHNDLTFYSSRQIENYLVNGKTSSQPLSNIVSDDDLKKLLNVFPSIFNGSEKNDGNGWIGGKVVRMLGVPRLRQSRNKKKNPSEFTGTFEETRDFRVGWESEKSLKYENKFWRVSDPWKFRESSKLNSLPSDGILEIYSGSGYASHLGRTKNNSVTVLKFLVDSDWIDKQTKVLFIESTFFSVDSGIFNVVTASLEKTSFGQWISSHNVHTAEFFSHDRSFSKLLLIGWLAAILLILTRSTIRKMTSRKFFKGIANIADLIIILIAFAWIVSQIVRHHLVSDLIKRLKTSRNNEFLPFAVTAFSDSTAEVLYGVLVAITSIRLWNILKFTKTFRALNLTLFYAAGALISTWFLLIFFLIGFSSAINIINETESRLFSTFMNTFTTITAQALKFNSNIHNEKMTKGGHVLSALLFAILILLIIVFLMNMVSSVVVVYNKQVRKELKQNPTEKVFLWKTAKKKLYRILGKNQENELKFMHRSYTINRTEHIKKTIDAQIEFLEKYLETSQTGEFLTSSMIVFKRSWAVVHQILGFFVLMSTILAVEIRIPQELS